jgi:putative inorganic carbon (HCO3(-)) transporter
VVQHAGLNSFAWRKLLWTEALNWMGVRQYMFGAGGGSFMFNSAHFFSLSGGRHVGAHSVIVQLLFEYGVLGIAAYLLMFWRSAKEALKVRFADRTLAVIALALIVSYLLISSSDNMLDYLLFNWYFWFTIGAICSVAVKLPATAVPEMSPRYAARRGHGRLS